MASQLNDITDLSKLDSLDVEEILQQLKQRFYKGNIYTYIGDVLIAVNPYENIPKLYDDELLTYYQTARDPPHIYWTAEQTYKRLRHEQGNQCIIVTGDSGAGKTESTKHLLKHLVTRSPCEIRKLVEKLIHVNPLIELFGNATTLLNRNSSRFGKLIELLYDTEGTLTGGRLNTFVLEKSRIVHQRPCEKNFHIFHALFAGNSDKDLRDNFYLEKPNEYRIMLGDDEMPHTHRGVFQNQEEREWYRHCFTQGHNILKQIEFTISEISQIFNILAACLHLGNIEYTEVGVHTYSVAIREDIYLQHALSLLGLEDSVENLTDINESLISRPIVVHGQTVQKPFNQIQAEDVRDSIIQALYGGVFRAIIDQINKSIGENSSRSRQLSIGILDISGFESLQENSLEQLFINITNEQIQQFHQKQIFHVENKEYIEEGIQLPPNIFQDNTAVLQLIFDRPGILSVLDDQMKITNIEGKALVTAYNSQFVPKSNVYKQCRNSIEFSIIHYAGQVTYCAKHFLAKNRGTIPERIKELFIERSDNDFVNTYFDVSDTLSRRNTLRGTLSKRQAKEIHDRYNMAANKTLGERPSPSRPTTNSAAIQYRKSLTCLIDTLAETKPLFVRCIKSNAVQQMKNFDEKVVLHQLESAGIKDVARIRRDGYQIRVTFDKFIKMYHIFSERSGIPDHANSREHVQQIINSCMLDKNSYQLGRTKVFLKGHAVEQINCKMNELIQKRKEEERRKKEQELEKREIERQLLHKTVQDKEEKQVHNSTTRSSSKDKIDMESSFDDADSIKSNPPPYSDIENEKQRNEGGKRWAWDAFRNTERYFDGGVELENCFLKFCRFLLCFGLFVGILSKGVCTVIIPLLKVSQLHTNEDDVRKSVAVTELIVCYSVPITLTFIQSLFKICLGRVKNVGWAFFIPVLLLESVEVCGTAYLLFKVLPRHSTTSGITLIMMSFTCPAILNIRKHILLARHRRKFISRLLAVTMAIVAVLIQCGVLTCLIVQPNLVLSDKHQVEYSVQESVLLVVSLVAISLGSCQNFLTCDIRLGSLQIKIMDWRIAVTNARPKINLWLCIIKVGIFLGMAKLLVPDSSWTLTSHIQQPVATSDISEFVTILEDHALMFTYIYCSIFASYEGILACKLHMQRVALFGPLILVPLGCYCGVIGYCYKWPNDNILGGTVACPNIEIDDIKTWIGFSIGLWISLILLTWHVIFPQCHRMERAERLFVLPTKDSFFSAFGLLMKRKDDVVEHRLLKHAKFKSNKEIKDGDKIERKPQTDGEEKPQRRKKKKQKNRPYLYICATMWHETRIEMLQLMKSLFRLDFHRSKYKIAESVFDVNVDYFEQEIHIIFDDAFQTDKKSSQRLPNEWVKQLVECIEEASTSVAKGHLKWDTQPKKTSTPYGGRLSWIMPGGTEMVFHLKDKDKIRHRKRWSQIFYMYYLLGYKLMGSTMEDALLEKETNKRYHYRKTTSILNQLPKDKIKRAHNSFILALDGDVDFKPESVQKLIDKMTKNDKVGAVCGRIHPTGSGPVVWYQQFEYAIGHWLQKAAEHVFGCVLCCPGAFSLFRATSLMDDNVMKMYTSPPLEARHYIQYEQGEDRWLCTLLLQQGWKIDYAASADAFTFAPETFQDFYIQRRRWAPSTLANIIDLLSSWRVTTKVNDNISTLYMFYQFVLLATSLLGIGTVTLMITGSFTAVLKTTMLESYIIVLVPIGLYVIICFKCSNEKQIAAAVLLSTIYTVVMVIVTVGLFVVVATEKPYSPNVIFFTQILFIFLCSGIVHPKEFLCLIHGLLYYIMIPSTFIFLTVYYMCNIHVVSWGTRENNPNEDNIDKTSEADISVKEENSPLLLRCVKKLGILSVIKEAVKLFKQAVSGEKLEKKNKRTEMTPVSVKTMDIRQEVPLANSIPLRRLKVKLDHDAWQTMDYLGTKGKETIFEEEMEFWRHILQRYLKPIAEDKKKKNHIEAELKSLRNNVAFGFLILNFLFATAIFQLQNNEDQIKSLYILNEYEPISVTFLVMFSLVILVQFIGMLVHRWGTFLHLISSVRLWSFSKETEDKWAKQALKETETLQAAVYDAGSIETGSSISYLSIESRLANRGNMQDDVEPDYPDEEPSEDYPDDEPSEDYPVEDIIPHNEYERNFKRRFQTIRHNLKQSGNNFRNDMVHSYDREVNRINLYRKTLGRRAGIKARYGHV